MCETTKAIKEGNMEKAWLGITDILKEIRKDTRQNVIDIALIKQGLEFVKEDIASIKETPSVCNAARKELNKEIQETHDKVIVLEEDVKALKGVNKFLATNWEKIIKYCGYAVVGIILLLLVSKGLVHITPVV